MRSFEVITVVTGCATCPYSTLETYCEKEKEGVPGYESSGVYLNRTNRYTITETCPMYKESKDD